MSKKNLSKKMLMAATIAGAFLLSTGSANAERATGGGIIGTDVTSPVEYRFNEPDKIFGKHRIFGYRNC